MENPQTPKLWRRTRVEWTFCQDSWSLWESGPLCCWAPPWADITPSHTSWGTASSSTALFPSHQLGPGVTLHSSTRTFRWGQKHSVDVTVMSDVLGQEEAALKVGQSIPLKHYQMKPLGGAMTSRNQGLTSCWSSLWTRHITMMFSQTPIKLPQSFYIISKPFFHYHHIFSYLLSREWKAFSSDKMRGKTKSSSLLSVQVLEWWNI